MTIRAALVGCGKIGWMMADDPLMAGDVFTHAEAYERCAATELVAVCDADAELAARCAERWQVPGRYSDIATMAAEAAPEMVSVCTPDRTHYAVARQLIEEAPSVRVILCEKPLATSLEEAEALVDLARERGKLLAVVYMRRYADNFRALRRFLDAGEIGAVRAVTGWSTKGVLHNGTHWFDMLRMLAGEPQWVEASDRLGEKGGDPTLDVTLGLASGAVATLRGFDSRAYTLFEMDILGEAGRIAITDSGHDIRVWRTGPSPRYSGHTELVEQSVDFGHRRNLMLRAVADLAAALREGRAPLSTAEDGLSALRIGIAALKAAATGRRIGTSPDLPQL